MWGIPLLKFNPIKVVSNLSNWMEVTFQHYFDKLLHTVVEKTRTCYWVPLHKSILFVPAHVIYFVFTIVFAIIQITKYFQKVFPFCVCI